ncbi:tape measure protein [Acidovorax sp. ACV02]|uniref:tape measure protein n=1 Tax=Acidovorax sp. ACV02 TaxID=2769310 RepID=UPI00177F9CC2|nr:tape measure protein [Acidovorax sp. ACV02]MBD9405395.1 tape measure protein [Acidovorax sp. ACV02]
MADKQVSAELRVGVTGRESITGLADDLDDVSKVLTGELSKSAQSAAARLRELAEQDAAISAFLQLQTEARDAGRALKAAETEAANYGRQIAAMGPPTAQEVAAQQRLQAGVDAARVALSQQEQALSGAQTALQRFGVSGQNARDAQQRLRQEVAGVREAIQDLVPAYQGAATGASNAGETMVRTHRQIGDGVESISQQLARLQSFYAALQGFQGLKTMASDLAETADQVNNLQARLKLVTGEGDNFTRSWNEVTQVALRTHSALEETGVLFTRLAQAGKDAGLSTVAASTQALALTETINQTIQLSGASAQASSAAITQLVQGLQGGALRGDEFNSVMEQSPRLARALADGLGVTTGELRKMAEAGLLTSDTVIKALQGQSQTVAAEFSKLPPTVGRALQDLSTQWTLYVSETDKATGASATAASAISALANNLKTVAGLLIDVGQATAAFMAFRLAQHFLGIGVAAQASAAAVAANNVQMVASGNAAATAAVGASRFATILASLRTFALIGLVANFKDIGTAIGEAAAKLAGYKDRTDELARADKLAADIAKEAAADRARLATAIQTAVERTFDLSKAARSGVAEFEKLSKEGVVTAEALKKATDAFDLSKVQGIRDFSAVLEKLAADGKISLTELQAAWSKALDGKDLAEFEVKARAAFFAARSEAEKAAKAVRDALEQGVTGEPLAALKAKAEAAFAVLTKESERSAQLMDSLLREAVKRTGLEFEQLQGRVGATSRSAINDVEAIIAGLDKLKAEGVDTGRALTASLSKAIQSADSEKALETVRSQIEQVRKVLGDKIADGLLDQAKEKALALKDALDQATPGINSVREALKQLGVTSDETLKKTATDAKEAYDTLTASGTASARELGEGFKRAAEAAIAANKGVAPAWVEGQAAVRGYEVQLDAAGKATLKLRDSIEQTGASSGRVAPGMQRDWGGVTSAIRTSTQALQEYQRRMQQTYGRPGEGDKGLFERGRFSSNGQELGGGVQEVGTGGSQFRNKDGWSSDAMGRALTQGIWTRTAIIDYLKQAGLDELLARKLSEQFVDANGKVPYTAKDVQKRWAGKFGTLSEALGNMAEYYKYTDEGNADADQMLDFERRRRTTPQRGPATSAGGSGGSSGATYVSNITIDGQPTTVRFADAESQGKGEDLLRRLARAKSTAVR